MQIFSQVLFEVLLNCCFYDITLIVLIKNLYNMLTVAYKGGGGGLSLADVSKNA